MRRRLLPLTFTLAMLTALAAAQGRDLLVPAGTLLQCTMDEPDFSTATVNVGDPFLCYPRATQQFGQTVFPRGTYMVGHLEAARDPGRLVGKGYLRLTIDRIGLPESDVPLNAKVISVAGYKVDRDGNVIGHGHATRDVLEWMVPPLWPWKLIMLPARGPRPDLKGEVRITLRVMDDLTVPRVTASLNAPPALSLRPAPAPGWRYFGQSGTYSGSASGVSAINASLTQPVSSSTMAASWPAGATLFATTDGGVVAAGEYWRQGDELLVNLTDGEQVTLNLDAIDWGRTTRLNAARDVRVVLRETPAETSDRR